MPENLKRCPFCGNPAELVNEYGKWIVKCSSEADCQGQVDISPSGLNGWESAELAVDGWNERAHEPRRTDASQGMSDGELIARAILEAGGVIAHYTSLAQGGGLSHDPKDPLLGSELDRREAARKESKP